MKGNTVSSQENSVTTPTCGSCSNWKETKDRCPGWGYCAHTRASTTRVGEVNVSCRFLPAEAQCLIPRR